MRGVSYALRLSDAEAERYRLMAEGAAASEQAMWAIAGIHEGAVGEIGCGPGAMSVLLAGIVGSSGRVCAVDGDAEAVAMATVLAEHSGARNMRTTRADVAATGLPAGSLDVAMMRHVLAHNGGREQEIVDHLAELVRPGGAVYLLDTDASALRLRPTDADLEDLNQRYIEFQRRRGNDTSVGLRLAELLSTAGLDVQEFAGSYQMIPVPPGLRSPPWAARDEMVTAGLAQPADLERWEAAFARIDAGTDRPTTFVPKFVGIGRRPS